MTALAREHGVSDRVEFLGILDDVRRLWRRCDVAVFPSHQFIGVRFRDGGDLEAMACGKPDRRTRKRSSA